MPKKISPSQPYAKLLQTIRKIHEQGLARAKEAVERQLLMTNWETGRLLATSVFVSDTPDKRNARIVARLSRDLERPKTYFYSAAKFYRCYPRKSLLNGLSWSHYRVLSTLTDKRKRQHWERKALKEDIDSKDLRRLIFEQKQDEKRSLLWETSQDGQTTDALAYVRGRLYYYKLIEPTIVSLSRPGWLVDIFYSPAGQKDPVAVAAQGRFLNQELVENGLAAVVN